MERKAHRSNSPERADREEALQAAEWRHALFPVAATSEADRLAVGSGISISRLMANAGARVAEAVLDRWPACPVEVLCGPGDNGGDGYVAALRLRMAGRPVCVRALGTPNSTAAKAAEARWTAAGGDTKPLADWDAGAVLSEATPPLLVDALFGAGLSRPLAGPAARTARQAGIAGAAVLSVDVPSGVDGDSGRIRGEAFSAAATVSFERARPGHFLGEGGSRTGDLIIRPIGIPARVLERVALQQTIWRSHPGAWRFMIDRPDSERHKYCHGHVLVCSGPPGAGGAARLAAHAALRAGAGLVTVAAPYEAVHEHAAQLNAVMVRGVEGTEAWVEALLERRVSAAVIGPGFGPGAAHAVLAALESQTGRPDPVPLVLDADALTAFEAKPDALFRRLAEHPALLTPHAGEFSRLFPDLGGKLGNGPCSIADIVRDAARRSGAVVLLKGRCTIVATPGGDVWLNDATGPNAVPWLATAGAGDVLAGVAAGIIARGAELSTAAAAASWIHARAARKLGPGLTADDLPNLLPAVLNEAARLQDGH